MKNDNWGDTFDSILSNLDDVDGIHGCYDCPESVDLLSVMSAVLNCVPSQELHKELHDWMQKKYQEREEIHKARRQEQLDKFEQQKRKFDLMKELEKAEEEATDPKLKRAYNVQRFLLSWS